MCTCLRLYQRAIVEKWQFKMSLYLGVTVRANTADSPMIFHKQTGTAVPTHCSALEKKMWILVEIGPGW